MKWSTGILGLNARNILYIKPFNKKKAIRLADNKLESKNFFHAHKIATATVYKVIHNKKELENFHFRDIAAKSFVIKPNRGFGGEGIKIVVNKSSLDTERERHLKNHIANILDGNYSLTNAPDVAIIEQRIICHPDLAAFSYQGLPDIRIIVHNLIPVMAMIRFPTKASDGKANYHAGGAIAGIDLASGKITRVVIHNKTVDTLPDKNVSPVGFAIPQWNEILLMAAQAQLHSNIGYLAIDIVLNSKNIPMVLEMNARGGLSIQVANNAKLRERLDRIKGLKVKNPERGVRLCKELFGTQQTTEQIETELERISGKEVLGSYEPVNLFSKTGKSARAFAVLDTNKIYTSIDRDIAVRLGMIDKTYDIKGNTEFFRLILELGKKRVRTFVTIKDYSEQTYKVAIGRRNLRNVFIDPFKGLPGQFQQPPALITSGQEQEHEADQLLGEIYEKLSFLYHLMPTNNAEEKKKWFHDPHYVPQFQYQQPTDFYESTLRELEAIPQFDSDIGILIKKRSLEIVDQINLLKSIGKPSFNAQASKIFRPLTSDELALATNQSQLMASAKNSHEERIYSAQEIASIFTDIFASYGINEWRCRVSKQQFSSIRIRKNHQIGIPVRKILTQARLEQLIAHEILTHILSRHNGEKQKWNIFSYGFPGYIYTQEGLAVYNEIQAAPESHNKVLTRGAKSALLTEDARNMSGSELLEKLLQTRKRGAAWRAFVRLKRGMTDTELPGGLGRENIYFVGLNPLLTTSNMPVIYYAGRVSREYVHEAEKYNSLPHFPTPNFPIAI